MRAAAIVLLTSVIGCQTDPAVSSIDQPLIAPAMPNTVDFDALEIGQTSARAAIEVGPAPGANDDFIVSVVETCPDFVVDAPDLPAHVFRTCKNPPCTQTKELQTYKFLTAFRPTVAGAVSCVVAVTTMAGQIRNVTLSGIGVPPPIRIAVAPSSVEFGDVRRNADSSPVTVSVGNTGSQPMTVSSVMASAGFSIKSGPASPHQIGPNDSSDYAIACRPTDLGVVTGALTVISNDPVTPSVAVPLSCTGIESDLDVIPSPAAVETTRVGEPVGTTIELKNTGTASMTIESVVVAGDGFALTASPSAGTVLAPSASTQASVRFDAATGGDASGMLVVTYDGGRQRTAPITARALSTSMALIPDGDVELGPVCVGQTAPTPFTIMANDQGSFEVVQITDPGPPFTLAGPALPVLIRGAGTNKLTFTVTVAPRTTGIATSSFLVTTDIPGGAARTIQLSVEGLAAGITASPAVLDIGTSPVSSTSIGQPVHLSNCEPVAIAVANARIGGADAGDFAIVSQPETPTIAPATHATWLVVFQPHAPGPKHATFLVDHDGTTSSVPLVGEGFGSSHDVSYYTCAAGRPTASWPLAVAFVVLRRRRDRARAGHRGLSDTTRAAT